MLPRRWPCGAAGLDSNERILDAKSKVCLSGIPGRKAGRMQVLAEDRSHDHSVIEVQSMLVQRQGEIHTYVLWVNPYQAAPPSPRFTFWSRRSHRGAEEVSSIPITAPSFRPARPK